MVPHKSTNLVRGVRTTPCSRHCEAASQSIADLSAGGVAEAIYVLRLRSLSPAREIAFATPGILPRNDGRGICLERILAMTSGITASSGRHPVRALKIQPIFVLSLLNDL